MAVEFFYIEKNSNTVYILLLFILSSDIGKVYASCVKNWLRVKHSQISKLILIELNRLKCLSISDIILLLFGLAKAKL